MLLWTTDVHEEHYPLMAELKAGGFLKVYLHDDEFSILSLSVFNFDRCLFTCYRMKDVVVL